MWITYISPNQDPKKMAKRKEQFLPLDGDRKQSGGISETQRQRFIEEYKKYQDKLNT